MNDLTAWLAGVLDDLEASDLLTDREQGAVDAHRAIAARHEPSYQPDTHDAAHCLCCGASCPCPDIRVIAGVYADRPDYDLKWAAA